MLKQPPAALRGNGCSAVARRAPGARQAPASMGRSTPTHSSLRVLAAATHVVAVDDAVAQSAQLVPLLQAEPCR